MAYENKSAPCRSVMRRRVASPGAHAVLALVLSLGTRSAAHAEQKAPPAPVLASPSAAPAAPAATPAPVTTSAPVVAAAPAALPPLSAAVRQALAQITPDPAPPELVRNTHYVVSNEDRHDLFRRVIENRGGVHIGVGTDQNYILAAWAKPQLLILFDFDQVVVNVHHVYRSFFLTAKTPEELRNLWHPRNEAQALATLTGTYPDEKQRADAVRAYKIARYAVTARFNKILNVFKQHSVSWFLNDQAQYDSLVALFRADRVVMVRGDLTAGGCLSSIASALTQSGLKVGLLYLSNAERYFTYTPGFRKSMLALPVDEGAQVLRTRARLDGVYEYMSQDAATFRAWLESGRVTIASQMSRQREDDPQTPGAFVIRKLPK